MSGVYDDPTAYEVAYSFRDVTAECDFLTGCVLRRLGRPPRSACELAAGPATHLRELVRRGVRGFAVEQSPRAVAWLREAAPEVVSLTGDLRACRLPEAVDLVFCPLNGFAYLLDDDAWLAALETAAANLVPGGVLMLELVPGDVTRTEPAHWHVERAGVHVDATATPSVREGDQFRWELQLRMTRDGRTTEHRVEEHQRAVTAAQAVALVRQSHRFDSPDLYADWDVRRRWHGEPTVVLVAKRRST